MAIEDFGSVSKMNDHDLLIVVHTTLARLESDIRDMKENLASRVAILELQKLDKTEAQSIVKNAVKGAEDVHSDHERRLRTDRTDIENLDKKISVAIARLATWGAALVVGIGIAEFIVAHVLHV